MTRPSIRTRARLALARAGAATAAVMAAELAYAVLRPSPDQEEFDASGIVGAGEPLHIGIMGDSSCTGPGLAHADEIWVRQTGRLLAERGFEVRLSSVAVGGARASDVLRDQLPQLLATDPDIVMIAIGSNDALKGAPPAAFERDLTAIVEALSTTRALVVLAGVGDLGTIPRLLPPLRQIIRARARRFDSIHEAVARRYGLPKADQWSEAARVLADPATFTPDLFHPGPRGHAAWAQVALDVLSPHLPPGR